MVLSYKNMVEHNRYNNPHHRFRKISVLNAVSTRTIFNLII